VAAALASAGIEHSVLGAPADAAAPVLDGPAETEAELVESLLADTDGPRIVVVPATLAKGLEYDQVIVLEPAEIVAAEPRGLRRLYVVLTRAVSRLHVLHAEPLPSQLTN
jgi:sirohydrochlorin ferrochelatase